MKMLPKTCMNPRFLLLTLAVTSIMSLVGCKDDNDPSGPGDAFPLVVRFLPEVDDATVEAIHAQADSVIISENDSLGFQYIEVAGMYEQEAIAYYSGLEEVDYVEPIIEYSALWTPNDPLFASDQYGPQIMDAEAAWYIGRSSAGTVLAVVDSGIDDGHPDLAGKIVQGYDFVDNDYDTSDESGHSTLMAGVAAAVTNNGAGIAGIAPNATIMAVRVLDAENTANNVTLANGISYAADYGAQVILVASGGETRSQTLQNAIDYAWTKGVFVVAAAGNAGTSSPHYPAYYINAFAVAATDSIDGKWSEST